ncbi:MAG: hypothetical protein WC380_12385, partial [Pedobacter sp.]
MITKIKISLFSIMLGLTGTVTAQQKTLNFKEVFISTPKDILNPLPLYRSWTDNSHYIEYRT